MSELECLRAVAEAARSLAAEAKFVARMLPNAAELASRAEKVQTALAALDAVEPDGWQQLIALLRDHINTHMDQFDNWRIKDTLGNTVYINLSYYPAAPEEVYVDLDAPPPTPESKP